MFAEPGDRGLDIVGRRQEPCVSQTVDRAIIFRCFDGDAKDGVRDATKFVGRFGQCSAGRRLQIDLIRLQ